MKESLETNSSLESYMIMYLSESEDEEPDNDINKIKKEKHEKNKDIIPFFESEEFPFNDQTFEDVALYLWNQQQQDEMEDHNICSLGSLLPDQTKSYINSTVSQDRLKP